MTACISCACLLFRRFAESIHPAGDKGPIGTVSCNQCQGESAQPLGRVRLRPPYESELCFPGDAPVPCPVSRRRPRAPTVSHKLSLQPYPTCHTVPIPQKKKTACELSDADCGDRMHPHVRPDSTPSWRSTTSNLSRSMRDRRSTPRRFRAGKESTPRPHTRCTPK